MKIRNQVYRQETRERILAVLRESGQPRSIGDLFLAVGKSHEFIKVLLCELQDEGRVQCKIMDGLTKTYAGSWIKRKSMHWMLAPESKRKKREVMYSTIFISKYTPAVLEAVCKQQGVTPEQLRLGTLKRVSCVLGNLLENSALDDADRAAIVDLSHVVRLAIGDE